MSGLRRKALAVRVADALERMRFRDLAAAAVLLVMAVVPVRQEIVHPRSYGPAGDPPSQLIRELETRRALARSEIPLWNPREFAGTPHLANPQTLVLYPPHVPLRLLPIELFLPVSFAVHAWLAGFGGYLVGRQVGAPRIASLAGGAAVMLGGMLAPGEAVTHSPVWYGLAWLPLVVAFALRSIERPVRLPHPVLVFAVCAVLLAGSLPNVIYALVAVTSCYLVAVLRPWDSLMERKHLLVQLALLACLAAGLTAFQTVPAVRFWMSAAQ